MVVRRYVVRDMPEAVSLIRKDLGKEAVILSTRKVYVKKWLGFWRAKRIEVMAAAGGDVPVKKTSGSTVHAGTSRISPVRAKQQTVQKPVYSSPVPVQVQNEVNVSQSRDLTGEISSLVREIQNLKGYIAQTVAGPKELKDLKDDSPRDSGSHLRNSLLHELRDLGFSHEYGAALIENYLDSQFQSYPGISNQEELTGLAKQQLASLLIQQLGSTIQVSPLKSGTRIALFVGPTGVGKTTTIAKLAALHVLSGKKKVGLLTTDTFRVAAIEQLKTYAGILNVPIGIIRRNEEITSILNQQNDRDLILIDTTGRNYRDPVYVEEMKELSKKIQVDETFLVLSMTGKPRDLHGLTKSFEPLQFDKFLFTKMDETSTFGAIVELLDRCRHPLSYITTGQNVPDDLEVASLQKIVNRAFGEEAHA